MYPSDQPEVAEKREADDQEDDESPSTEHQQDGDGHDNETQNDENVVSVEEDPEPEGNPESEEDPEPEGNPESEEDPEPEGDPELERDEEHGEENHDNVGPEQSNNPDGEEQTPTNVPENDSIQHRIALPLNDHQGQTSNHALKALDMKVLESTMDRETLKTVLTIGVKAFRTSDDYSEMAKIIKTEMDATCGVNWQVVVGEDYGAYVRTQSDKVVFFLIDKVFFYVFKSDLIGGGISDQTEPMA